MQAATEFKILKALEWCTYIPPKDQIRKSPVFSVEGNEWFFEIFFDVHDSLCLYPRLRQKTRDGLTGVHTFQVGLEDDQILNIDGGDFRLEEDVCVWSVPWDTIKRKFSFITGYHIKFRFLFNFPSDSNDLKIFGETYDKYVQAPSYLTVNPMNESLTDDLRKLLETGLDHDAEIRCQHHSVKAHKAILCARSEVFKTMLESTMLEGQTGILQIQEIEACYFLDFCRYLYTGILPSLTFKKAKALYKVGYKYAIRSLMLRCSEYLQDSLTARNVFDCYELGDAHSDKKLMDKAKAAILEYKIYLEEDGWLAFCGKFPKVAIELYRLSHKKKEE